MVLSDIPRLEQRFQLDINIFELSWIDGKSCGKIILRSEGLFKTDQSHSLVAFQGHFCLIKTGCWKTVSDKIQCSTCGRVLKHGCSFNEHIKLSCDNKKIKKQYTSAVHAINPEISQVKIAE